MSSTFQDSTQLLGVEITRERLQFWGIRYGLSVLDQGLTSGAGFLLNLFLARWLTSEAYGAFAVIFAILVFMSSFQNVLVLEPMAVLGPARYSAEMTRYLQGQLKVNAVVVVFLSGLILMASRVMVALNTQQPLVVATVSSAAAIPFLLLFWMVRRVCYVVQRPAIAVWASGGYMAFTLAGLYLLHTTGWLDIGRAFLLVAAASMLAVLVPLRQLRLLETDERAAYSWKSVVAENWNYGRWVMASAILYPLSNQAQTYLTAAMIGLGAAGILRAMQIPAQVMTQIVIATALLMLPAMSQEFGLGRTERLRKKALLSTFALTVMALVYALVLWMFAKPVEHILFAGKFAAYAWLIPLLGLVPLFTAFGTGLSMGLRAAQKPQLDLIANAVAAPIAILSAVVFIKLWGISGAALSLVAGAAAMGAVLFWLFIRLSKPACP